LQAVFLQQAPKQQLRPNTTGAAAAQPAHQQQQPHWHPTTSSSSSPHPAAACTRHAAAMQQKGLPTHAAMGPPHKPPQHGGLWDAARGLYAQHKIPIILCYYGLCSSTLIVINKLAVHSLQAPVFILMSQLLFAAATVKGAALGGLLEAEPLQWALVRPFSLIILGFLGTLYANIQVLAFSNVETFITFRSSTPLVLSLFDYALLGRELPGGRSIFSLVLLIASCGGYTWFDQGFKLQAYTWLVVWFFFFTFEACYVKHMCDTVAMSNWGRVYYTNLLAGAVLAATFPFCDAEHASLLRGGLSGTQVTVLAMSCVIGVGMSHAGYLMRSNVSATAGVVVGVVCKLGSVLLNLLIWDQHASPIQLCFLALGLAGGSLFRQAPLRATAAPSGISSTSKGGAGHGHSSSGSEEEDGLIKVFEGQDASALIDSDDGSHGSHGKSGLSEPKLRTFS
jgi:GDP-mannose transporter